MRADELNLSNTKTLKIIHNMKKIIKLTTIIMMMFVSSTHLALASPYCNKIAEIADSNASVYAIDLKIKIIGKKKARIHFYSAPDPSCKLSAFVIPSDQVTIVRDFKNNNQQWYKVIYENPGNASMTQGWITESNLDIP